MRLQLKNKVSTDNYDFSSKNKILVTNYDLKVYYYFDKDKFIIIQIN